MPEQPPEHVVTDGLASYSRAIAEELGTGVEHEGRDYQRKPVEQSHPPIKARYYSTLGFGAFDSGKHFCEAFDELHQYFRPHQQMTEHLYLSEQRRTFRQRAQELKFLFIAILVDSASGEK